MHHSFTSSSRSRLPVRGAVILVGVLALMASALPGTAAAQTAPEAGEVDQPQQNASQSHQVQAQKLQPDDGPTAADKQLGADKFAQTPPMGWNTFYAFKRGFDAQSIKEITDVMVESGMRDAGYEYVILDAGWVSQRRDSDGNLQADPAKFPNGIKAVADYVHERGMKFGIYRLCTHSAGVMPGGYGYEEQDAKLLAEWGVDWIKYDFCNEPKLDRGPDVDRISIAGSESFEASIEAESSANAIADGAKVLACDACSGGERVTGIGANTSSTSEGGVLRFDNVTVPEAGQYALTFHFTNGSPYRPFDTKNPPTRRIEMTVNSGDSQTVEFRPSGGGVRNPGWDIVDTLTVDVELEAGANTITMKNTMTQRESFKILYQRMSDAIEQTGRPMILEICEWGWNEPWEWGKGIGQLWRTSPDIRDNFTNIMHHLDQQVGIDEYAGPAGWNFAEMLRVGGGADFDGEKPGGMTAAEHKAQISLWSLLNSPLILSTDLRKMSDETLEMITNEEVIAVNQDWSGTQGYRLRKDGDQEVWVKPMSDGSRAVVLLNRGERGAQISVNVSELGLDGASSYLVRDLWEGTESTTAGTVSAMVEGHSVAMLRVRPAPEPEAPPMVSLDVEGPTYWPAGANPQEVSAVVSNEGRTAVRDVEVHLTVPEDWSAERVTPSSTADVRALAPGQSITVDFRVTPSAETVVGMHELQADVEFTWREQRLEDSSDVTVSVPPEAPTSDTALTDLTWTHLRSGDGFAPRPFHPRMGNPLVMDGVEYYGGLGVHAWSDIRYYLGAECTRFTAKVGIDDMVGSAGTVAFQVWADGEKLFDSGVMTGSSATQSVNVPIDGVTELRLVVTNGGDDKYHHWLQPGVFDGNADFDQFLDYGNWAAASVMCGDDEPVIWTTDAMLDRAKERVATQEEPFYGAWLELKADADAALSREYVPYNGGNHRTYFNTARPHAIDVRNLAIAFHVTGEKQYADKARQILALWAADAAENPDPAGDRLPPAGHPQGLVLGRAISVFADGYAMMWEEMSQDERAAVEQWFTDMAPLILESQRFWVEGENLEADLTAPYLGQQYFNNHLGAQNMGLAAIGFATDDEELIRYALNGADNPRDLETLIDGVILMPKDIGSGKPGDLFQGDPTLTDGAPAPEPGEIYDRYRTVQGSGLHYTHIHLRFITMTAEMARNNGPRYGYRGGDYFDYVGAQGENLEKSYEFYSEFLVTGDSGARTGYYEGDNVDYNMFPLYELATREYPGNEEIVDVLQSRDRVQFDREMLGWSGVLTHGVDGIAADPDEPEPPLGVTSWDFDTDGDAQGWTVRKATAEVSGGALQVEVFRNDPQVISPGGLGVDAEEYRYVKLRVRNSTSDTKGQVFFATVDDPTFGGNVRNVTVSAQDDGFKEYVVDMGTHEDWEGRVQRIRFDPVQGNTHGTVGIDSIEFSKSP